MLISLTGAIKEFNMHVRGIVHVGAHYGQEFTVYKENGIHDIVFIEPCWMAFKTLQDRVGGDDRVVLFKCACSDREGTQEMYTETLNQGQSNSLLKPKLHLVHHPEIQFTSTELVPLRTLDSLPFTRSKYNLLMMDTQGAEMMVLRGATETLQTIDYVYTEVNDQELYENNAVVSEIDAFLTGFSRVRSFWVPNKGWGDALYIRDTVLKANNHVN
jgi:FkbM family methyltransferase